jgi:hypothetical protein
MGKYRLGVMGTFKNKVGIVVGRKWRTIDVMSAYQGEVKNPNTSKQQLVRKEFGTLSALAASFAKAVRYGYAGVSSGTKVPQRCAFIKENYGSHVVEVDLPDTIRVDYTLLQVAKGSHMEASFGSPQFDEPLTVTVAWGYEVIQDISKATDKVVLVVYNPGDGRVVMAQGLASARTLNCVVPNAWNGETVHVWGFVIDGDVEGLPTDPNQVSMSHYIGNGSIS